MSLSTILFILTCSVTLLPAPANHACVGVAEVASQDPFEESKSLTFQLLQESLTISSGKKRTKELHCLPSPNFLTAARDLPEQQILAELQLARHAHQQWENRVTALEAMLPSSRNIKDELSLRGQEAKHLHSRGSSYMDVVYIICVFLISSLAILAAIGFVVNYEKQRHKVDAPWYHDHSTLQKVIAAVAVIWFSIGMFFCTNIILFNEGRHLTIVESLYTSVQIVTTIGYGDFVAVTPGGWVFQIFNCLLGVTLTGAALLEVISHIVMKSDGEIPVEGQHSMATLARATICVFAGVVLFTAIHGENKTVLEALYMSVITLLTIGFGDFTPITVGGQLASSLWMLVGVACVTKEVGDFANYVTQERRYYRSKASAFKYFTEVCGNDQAIDRAEFLRFELVRQGVAEAHVQNANKQFDEFDSNLNGELDSNEFRSYVEACFS